MAQRTLLATQAYHAGCLCRWYLCELCIGTRQLHVSPFVHQLHLTTLAPLPSSLLQIQATAAWEKMQAMLIGIHRTPQAHHKQHSFAHSCALRDFSLNLECRLFMPRVSFCHKRVCFPDTRGRHLGRRNEGNLRGAGQSERHECKGYPCM